MADLYERHVRARVSEALADTPATVVQGPRQSGKTTLARSSRAAGEVDAYLSLDDDTVVDAALGDPAGFVAGLPRRVALDEIQRAPTLLPAIKASIDADRALDPDEPRRFLLTGSVDILSSVAESLAGRVQIETVWPLSQGELADVREGFLERLFDEALGSAPRAERGHDLIDRVLAGGFPDAVRRPAPRRREWLRSYVSTLVQRDARDLAAIDPRDLRRLLGLVAARATGVLNVADLSRAAGLPQSTARRYLHLLERLFLVVPIPAWHANVGQRLVKAEKLFLSDSALHASLVGATAESLRRDRSAFGPLLEGFVAMELVKQASWAESIEAVFHFRTARGVEVDFVLEDRAGRVAAVEVKAASTVRREDFRGMELLAQRLGDRFASGVVLYAGDVSVPFSERVAAWPLDALWSGGFAWRVVGGPTRIDRSDLDADVWRWRLESDGEQRDVDVQISRTALAVAPESLPDFARVARETNGRNVVSALAARTSDLPSVVAVHSRLRALPAV
jgi:uncharacterized protein